MKVDIKTMDDLFAADEDGLAIIDYHFLKDRSLDDATTQVHGWRGLFDPCSHEFSCSSLEKKWKVIEMWKRFLNCGFDGIVYLVATNYNEDHTCYINNELPKAVYDYAIKFREAENYLMRCHHPLFSKFAANLKQDWKTSTQRNIIEKPVPLNENNLELLLTDSILPFEVEIEK